MKKFVFIAFVLMFSLIGFGCNGGGGEVETTDQAKTPDEGTVVQQEEAPSEASPVVEPESTSVQSEVETKTTTPTPTQATTQTQVTVQTALNVSMQAGDFFFTPSTITASPGQTVNVTFTGATGVHTFAIAELGLEETVSPQGVVTFTAPKTAGQYTFYCSVGQHQAKGMVGTLTVK